MTENYISLERAVKRMYAVTEEFGTQHIFIDRIVDELENIPSCPISTPSVPGPSEDASNNKDMYFKCGMRHMKAMVLAMLQDILDQEDGLCLIDLSEVIKAVEDL